jgi:hypothetical protein
MAEYTSPGNKGHDDRKPNGKEKVRGLKDEEAFPVDFVDEFVKGHCRASIDAPATVLILSSINTLVNKGKLTQMPPIEFLIQPVREGEEIRDPADNYRQWVKYLADKEACEANHPLKLLADAVAADIANQSMEEAADRFGLGGDDDMPAEGEAGPSNFRVKGKAPAAEAYGDFADYYVEDDDDYDDEEEDGDEQGPYIPPITGKKPII